MIHLKYFQESFINGVEELDGDEWRNKYELQKKYKSDRFSSRELDFIKSFFVKSGKFDFWNPTKLTTSSSGFRVRYMPSIPRNPIRINIHRLADYYYISISPEYGSKYTKWYKVSTKMYLIDTFEDLVEFMENIEKIHTEMENSAEYNPPRSSYKDEEFLKYLYSRP